MLPNVPSRPGGVPEPAAGTLPAVMTDLGAHVHAELVRRSEVSPRELVDAAIARIERVNPQLNAVIIPLYEKARGTLKLGFADAVGLLIETILQSPGFLYHSEGAASAVEREGALVRLGQYEVASRLSYFLVGSMPDKDLLAAAAANQLATAAQLEPHARRLLADKRARETVAAFVQDWLDLEQLDVRIEQRDRVPAFFVAERVPGQ